MNRGWYLRLAVVVVSAALGFLALWPSLGQWVSVPQPVSEAFEGRISPGLDIKGGLRLMYEVEVEEYIGERRDRFAEQLLRQCGVLVGLVSEDELESLNGDDLASKLKEIQQRCKVDKIDRTQLKRWIRVELPDASDNGKFTKAWLNENFKKDLRVTKGAGTQEIELAVREDQLDELTKNAVAQAVRTIGDRIDTLGLKEATVIGRESDIIVEVPGAGESSFERIKSIISRTARLEFKIADDESNTNLAAIFGTPPEGLEIRSGAQPFLAALGDEGRELLLGYINTLTVPDDRELAVGRFEGDGTEVGWRSYYLHRLAGATGEDLEDAAVGFDSQTSTPLVTFAMNRKGSQRMGDLTGANVGKRMAVVLDDRVESAPTIQSQISSNGQITLGSFLERQQLLDEANDLAVVLQAGALPAPLSPANEQLIGPTLGRDAVAKGAKAAVIGVIAVLLFMILYYQVAGLVSAVMVALNLLLLLGIMAALEATLTLPGVAAIALTVGMAVDANVLIIERIREELRLGKSPRSAVEQGFGRAYSSVFDSQLTTAIAGIVLLQFGTGPIKGFATMLLIGIATSLFTGTFCSKVFFDWIVGALGVKRLRVG